MSCHHLPCKAALTSLLVFCLCACQSLPPFTPNAKLPHDSQALLDSLPEPSDSGTKLVSNTSDSRTTMAAESAVIPGLGLENRRIESEPEPVPPNFWAEVQAGFQLDHSIENRRLQVQRKWYARHPDYIDRVLERGAPYLFHIHKEVQTRGMPAELVLLPIVESAFDPFAYSHGRASGIWQFIPGTGKMFGLKQTWWYDGRRDIVAATRAALDYLSALNKQFDGDWLHALAAYNSGAGNVNKAIRYNKKRGKPTDFWNLRLPRETRAYVPKLIALAQIFDAPEKYGATLREIPYEENFVQVDTGSQIDLSQAADLAEMSLKDLYRYNPGFNRWATDPDGPHHLLIPVENAEIFRAGLEQLPPEQRVQWSRYTIKRGDSLITIAKRHNITVALLKDVNHLRDNRIVAGKTLLIPKASGDMSDYTLSLEQRLQQKKNQPRDGRAKSAYRVKRGDSFWTIAKQYGVSVRNLAKWNGMAPTDTLREGQDLVIWTQVKASGPTNQIRRIQYRARNGDSYAKIAQKFNITLAEIQRWNEVDLKKYLQPGDRLTLYVDIRSAP